MAIVFPSNPTNGQSFTTANGLTYIYYSSTGNWSSNGASYGPFFNKNGDTLVGAINYAPAQIIASASTTNIGAATANHIQVTGTATITSFDTVAEGVLRYIMFPNAGLTLVYNSTNMVLPTYQNIITLAGDHAEFRSRGTGNWSCIRYNRSDGTALTPPPQSAFNFCAGIIF